MLLSQIYRNQPNPLNTKLEHVLNNSTSSIHFLQLNGTPKETAQVIKRINGSLHRYPRQDCLLDAKEETTAGNAKQNAPPSAPPMKQAQKEVKITRASAP